MNQSELYNEKLIEGLLNGRASVLVGAGFSLNALRANESVKHDLPLWNGLIDVMYEKLDLAKDRKEYLNPLSVAQQFEEMYDRPSLNKCIKDTMKDDDYIPSKVHKDFLELPWKNVFTTNYDTLLERTCKKIINRKYNIISREDDLLYADGNPKIVKLHGTFPLYDSLIITEEDYRTYPKKHARFVNTVQQALLEDMFCVIGFSGSDPNFLNWIGWIHDNIGLENSPIIYMITDQKKSEAETKSLAAKKIQLIIIDDILGDETTCNNTNGKYKYFISYLKDQIEEKKRQATIWFSNSDIKYIDYKSEDEEKLLNYLRDIHERYLGWIIAPYEYAKAAEFILNEINQYYINRDEKKFPIEVSFEYCWLHDICCIPLELFYVRRIEELIGKKRKADTLDQNQKYKLQYIMTILLKFYRFTGNDKEWQRVHELIKEDIISSLKNNVVYEEIMNDIYHLDIKSAIKDIDKMDIKENEVTWILRKASLLAMFGFLNESKQLLEAHLFNVRYSLSHNNSVHNFHSLSLESCMTTLYGFICHSIQTNKINSEMLDEDFFDKNPKYDFIWKNENQKRIYKIRKGIDDEKKDEEQYLQSDFDRVFTSVPIIRSVSYEESAIAFLAFREDTAIPFIIGNYKFNTGSADAAYLISSISSKLPAVIATVSSNRDIIERVYTRFYVYQMEGRDVEELIDRTTKLFNNAIIASDESKNTIHKGIIAILPEFVSRLSVKCSKDKYNDILEIVKKLFQYNCSIIFDYDKCVRRILTVIPLDILYVHIEEFLEPNVTISEDYVDYFELFYDRLTEYDKFNPINEMPKKLKSEFKGYIEKAKTLNINNKQQKQLKMAYVTRLLYISRIYLLSEKEKNELRKLLINQNNILNELPYTGTFSLFTLNDILGDEENYFEMECNNIINNIEKNTKNYAISSHLKNALNMGILMIEKVKLNRQQVEDLIHIIKKACVKMIADKANFSSNKGISEIYDDNLTTMGFLLAKTIDKFEINGKDNAGIMDILTKLNVNNIPCAYLKYVLEKKIPFSDTDYVRLNYSSEFFTDSMYALIELMKAEKIKQVDDRLVKELIGSIDKVDDFQVERILESLNILAYYQKLSEIDINCLKQKLEFIDEVTNYRKASRDSIVQKMYVRKALTSLLFTLEENYKYFNYNIEEYLENEEFAEVRNAWYDRKFLTTFSSKGRENGNE